MTLIVAGISASTAWMVSDTLITGGDIPLRDRQYQIKCVPSNDTKALIGFAGDVHHGVRLMEQAADMPSGENVVHMLANAQREHASVDFLYAFLDHELPRLFRISDGTAAEVPATYIGQQTAFEDFQSIRHAAEIDPVPKAMETFVFGTRTPSNIPEDVSAVTVSMLRLFMQRGERDVGGWAVPYVLVKEGAFMCGYGYSVSDPIFDKITPGSVVPHGTAEAGGYGLSVTEFGKGEGLVVYWRLLPGGLVLTRQDSGYTKLEITGHPSEFKRNALEVLGKSVDIFFGDLPLGRPESLIILRDDNGKPAVAIAKRGNDLSFSVLNVETVFKSSATLDLVGKGPRIMTVQNLTFTLAEDKSHVLLKLVEDDKPVGQATLNATELDNVIAGLGEFRASLVEPVSAEPKKDAGSRELLVIDPAWRTERSPHADIDGVLVRLRHIGLGWVSFLLPRNECSALGKWLFDNSKTEAEDPPKLG
jgi:hypothetical protein